MTRSVEVALKSAGHGKLVRACVVVEGERAAAVTFTGDFFLEPPELLEELGQAMCGATAVDAPERAREFLARQSHALLVGAVPEDFGRVVVEALRRGGR
ncbi:MAG: biotin--protein ligase [Planctomycetes bacterium]|nr:biotin--protein ligase [Planctomycetota bacterium]